jgi:Sulfatase-modifying factor enzyme 1
MAAVRERTLASLVLVSEFIGEMLVQHEHQHNETMLQTLQLAERGVYAPQRRPASGDAARGMIAVEAGTYPIGDGGSGFAYDNERPRHEVSLAAFRIDRAPVTNEAFGEFVADGGYRRRELWTPEGWAIGERGAGSARCTGPPDGGERRFDAVVPRDPELPVMHVSWFEATRSPAGAAPGFPKRPNGRRPRGWPARSGATSTSSTSVPVPPARSSATAGSGLRGSSGATWASGRSRTPSTRRSSSTPATGCCAGRRGPPGRGWPASPFATGTIRTVARSSGASAAWRTAGGHRDRALDGPGQPRARRARRSHRLAQGAAAEVLLARG